jgi:2-(1,2-epoxy-1,2-dihydrophenyl)acetyl-CoA isomerase
MVITFNRPEKMNALGGTLLPEFDAALAEARGDDAVRAVVVTGAGRAWCAGADLSGGGGGSAPRISRNDRLDPKGAAGRTILSIWNLGKPTIAAVNGVAVGGGLGLASSFDFRIASGQARFATIFIKRALGPDYGLSWFLPRLVGHQRALELQMTGRMISAEEAREYGFVLEVVPHETLMDRAMAFAAELAKQPPAALYYHRRAVHNAMVTPLESHLDFEWQNQTKALASEEFREGVAAFVEKREPDYSRF